MVQDGVYGPNQNENFKNARESSEKRNIIIITFVVFKKNCDMKID